jgi:hypothetical protein
VLLQQGSDWVFKNKQHGTGHELNDRLEQLNSHGFVVRGRRDRVVQIGGHNIDLAELETIAVNTRRYPYSTKKDGSVSLAPQQTAQRV